jgi:FKBP-type peptidyl-prolyl cis-trans isomerase FkpA
MRESAARAMRVAAGALLVGLVGATGACTSPTSPTFRASFAQIDVVVGAGDEATSGKTLVVNYTGWLYDDTKPDKKGEKFDGSTPNQPFVFTLGSGQVIAGWDLGIVGMKVGGLRRLVIPSNLAYAREGVGSIIPPNATLVFDIELINAIGG